MNIKENVFDILDLNKENLFCSLCVFFDETDTKECANIHDYSCNLRFHNFIFEMKLY